MTQVYVGIDIAATTAAVHWHQVETEHTGACSIQQQDSHYRRLHQQLTQLVPPQSIHVVMEATGNYWLKLALFLYEQHYTVSVINPLQSKRFAQMHLKRTKTDAVDAVLLCQYGQMMQPDAWLPPSAICHQLRHLLERRDDILHMATQESNRLHALQQDPLAPKRIKSQIRRHLATLRDQAQKLLHEIETLLAQDSEWHVAAQRLLSIPGVGPVTATWLLVATHAFTRCDTPQQAASYAGVVPHHRRSGTSFRGRSSISGGHPKLRQALYMAAGICIQHNPILKAFYLKKVDEGKIKQVARIAVARKLMHVAWACVVKERDFDPNFGQQAQAA